MCLAFVVACGPQGYEAQIEPAIQNVIEENQTTATELDWKRSQNNPEAFFEMVRNNDSAQVRDEVCRVLSQLEPWRLSVFEGEIENPKNAEVLLSCHQALVQTLEAYWTAQRDILGGEDQPTVKDLPAPTTTAPAPEPTLSSSTTRVRSVSRTTTTTVPAVSPVRVENARSRFRNSVQVRDMSAGYFARTGDVQRKQLILTFDDGPAARLTPAVLEILNQFGAKAMFFVNGNRVDQQPQILQRIHFEGHIVANHGYFHWDMGSSGECKTVDQRKLLAEWQKKPSGNPPCTSDAMVRSNIIRGFESIEAVIGPVQPIFRFPFGSQRPFSRQLLKQSGVSEFFWTVDTEDWRSAVKDPKTGQQVSDLVTRSRIIVDQIDKAGRGIVLFHDIHRRTVEMLPSILENLAQKNYELVVLVAPAGQEFRSNRVPPLP